MSEQKAGHGQTCEKVLRPHLRARRPLFIPVPSEIRQGCQFLHGVVQVSGTPPRWSRPGLFPPCLERNKTKLIDRGWGQCGHGLTSKASGKVAICPSFTHFCFFFLGIMMGQLRSFKMAHQVKLRCSSTSFFPGLSRVLIFPIVTLRMDDQSKVAGSQAKVQQASDLTDPMRDFQRQNDGRVCSLQGSDEPRNEVGAPPNLFSSYWSCLIRVCHTSGTSRRMLRLCEAISQGGALAISAPVRISCAMGTRPDRSVCASQCV